MNKYKKIIIISIVAILLVLIGFIVIKAFKNKQTTDEMQATEENIIVQGEEKEPIVDEKKEIEVYKGDDRPYAVMIDNHSGAWPQAGLNKAFMVYEIIVEGGETRLMPVFKGAELSEIGPIRSSRHYFLDYALENDAIYVHYGWSPQAKRDISKLSVNNINGMVYGKSQFWRVNTKAAPHNVLTSTKSIMSIAKKQGYKTKSSEDSVLNYVADEVKLEDGISAKNVTIPYSTLQKVQYKYDSKKGVYTRYARGKVQTDYSTKENITTKNIIITFVANKGLNDGSGKGRQTIDNIGTFDGYYITNGKAIKIKCTKSSRKEKTVYKDLDGNEIEVNDGNTWMSICPKDAKVQLK